MNTKDANSGTPPSSRENGDPRSAGGRTLRASGSSKRRGPILEERTELIAYQPPPAKIQSTVEVMQPITGQLPVDGNAGHDPTVMGVNNTFSETIASGSTLIAGWNEQYDRWELLEIVRPGVRWAKAQSDWEENAGDPRVLCKSCNRDGTGVSGTSFYVYLPRSTSGDPAIFQDAVLAYSEDPDGVKVCVSDYMDDKIGTIKLWRGELGAIPEGWRLCDGASDAFDLAGRFPLGVDEGGQSDESAIGQTGDHRWHGQTENNHPAHPNHRHAYDTTSDKVDAGQDGTEQAWDASPTSTSWTSGVNNLEGESGEILGHYGPYNSGQDTDNRPPYRVVAFIERWK